MPRITVTDPRGHTQQMECAKGERLRSVLIKNSVSPYTSFTKVFNLSRPKSVAIFQDVTCKLIAYLTR